MKKNTSFLIGLTLTLVFIGCDKPQPVTEETAPLPSSRSSESVTLVLQTQGMHCDGCTMLVRNTIGKLDGVEEVEASWRTGIVTIVHDPSRASRDAIESAIEKAGYRVVQPAKDPAGSDGPDDL